MPYAQFLHSIFDSVPNGHFILVWTLAKKKSAWAGNVNCAIDLVRDRVNQDTYIGVGLSPKPFGESGRCMAKDISGIIGLWVDIDVAGPGHKKPNLPPDEEAALLLLKDVCPPTITINSGHGIQAWWVFREPWIFDTAEERQQGADLASHWIHSFQHRSSQHGWDVDSTGDIARVLRIPGTANCKIQDHTVMATILEDTGIYYNPSDLETYLVDPRLLQMVSPKLIHPKSGSGALTLSPDAIPPFDKWEALKENTAKVRLSWDHKRKDLQDQSASSYDLSLASFAVEAEWTDQEIADLLIAHRRMHGEDLKLTQYYYQRTIDRAKIQIEDVQSDRAADEVIEDAQAAVKNGDEEEKPIDKALLLEALAVKLGVKIDRIIRYRSEPIVYRMVINGQDTELGGSGVMLNQEEFRNRIADATNIVIKKQKPNKWDGIAQLLFNATEDEDLGMEGSPIQQASGWIREYLDERIVLGAEDEWRDLANMHQPFTHDGQVWLSTTGMDGLLMGIYSSTGQHVQGYKMAIYLMANGWSYQEKTFRVAHKVTHRGLWHKLQGTVATSIKEETG